jgi:hypothetical protein
LEQTFHFSLKKFRLICFKRFDGAKVNILEQLFQNNFLFFTFFLKKSLLPPPFGGIEGGFTGGGHFQVPPQSPSKSLDD